MSDRGPGATVRDGWIARRFVAVLTSGCVGVRKGRGSVVMEVRKVVGMVGHGSCRVGGGCRRVGRSVRRSQFFSMSGAFPFGVVGVLAVVVSGVLAVGVLAQGADDCYVGLVVEPGWVVFLSGYRRGVPGGRFGFWKSVVLHVGAATRASGHVGQWGGVHVCGFSPVWWGMADRRGRWVPHDDATCHRRWGLGCLHGRGGLCSSGSDQRSCG